jgi:hypothetical protein
VLDPLPPRWSVVQRTIVRWLGWRLQEATFFAGHLRTGDGRVVSVAAYRAASELAFQTATRLVEQGGLLSRLNRAWGCNTILLHVAKLLEGSLRRAAMAALVVDALARQAGVPRVALVLARPPAVHEGQLRALAPRVDAYVYPPAPWSSLAQRIAILAWWLRRELAGAKQSLVALANRLRGRRAAAPAEAATPGLLVVQEDDLSLDRSYRTQPHWLFREDGKPSFRTLVLQTASLPRLPFDRDELRAWGVTAVTPREFLQPGRRPGHPVQRRLWQDIRRCLFRAVTGPAADVDLLFGIGRLLSLASDAAAFCVRHGVTTFMTCENHTHLADAVRLVARSLKMATLSYQYSNMEHVGPGMMSTADLMLVFSPTYRDRWVRNGIRPGAFVDIGYVFDTSFPLLRRRASVRRARLAEAGARFVVCYFDENVQHDKYGIIGASDHHDEIIRLARGVLEDPALGVIVKTQFRRNSPDGLMHPALVEARRTGRYLELAAGAHRNIVFAAEAALSADLAVGHALGATAALEAALAGARAVLINPYGTTGANDTLYAQGDIVYPSLEAALEAIAAFRGGVSARAGLGDWSAILGRFDRFRDGRAGHRMRAVLEAIVTRDNRRSLPAVLAERGMLPPLGLGEVG